MIKQNRSNKPKCSNSPAVYRDVTLSYLIDKNFLHTVLIKIIKYLYFLHLSGILYLSSSTYIVFYWLSILHISKELLQKRKIIHSKYHKSIWAIKRRIMVNLQMGLFFQSYSFSLSKIYYNSLISYCFKINNTSECNNTSLHSSFSSAIVMPIFKNEQI